MSEKIVTVFTSTYNRKDLLPRLYDSLKNQTSFQFKWLVVDDGSSDNTKELFDKWIKEENNFEIKYYYKENGGMFTAVNMGVEKADTELFMNIDSDDWIPNDCIEKIIKIWNLIDHNKYVGIFGLDAQEDGTIIGEKFPEDLTECYLYEYYSKKIAPGDKKYIQKTDALKKVFPMVGYPGEKYFNNNVGHTRADKFGPLFVTNEIFCYVEYQESGLSKSRTNRYLKSPNNYSQQRLEDLSFPKAPAFFYFKASIHYVSSCYLAGKLNKILKHNPKKAFTILAFPFGICLALYIKYRKL